MNIERKVRKTAEAFGIKRPINTEEISRYIGRLINKGRKYSKRGATKNTNRETTPGNTITLVHTFNPREPNLFQIINSSLDILKGSERMKKIINQTKFVNSTRQAQNLKRILTKATFPKKNSIPVAKRCGQPRCKTCPNIQETGSIKLKNADQIFEIKDEMTCISKNLVYCITCAGCNKYYIGQTGDCLRNSHCTQATPKNHPELRQIDLVDIS